MASLAGSGQSTQEPFLHTPVPAAPSSRGVLLLLFGGSGRDRHGRLSPSCRDMGRERVLLATGCAWGS